MASNATSSEEYVFAYWRMIELLMFELHTRFRHARTVLWGCLGMVNRTICADYIRAAIQRNYRALLLRRGIFHKRSTTIYHDTVVGQPRLMRTAFLWILVHKTGPRVYIHSCNQPSHTTQAANIVDGGGARHSIFQTVRRLRSSSTCSSNLSQSSERTESIRRLSVNISRWRQYKGRQVAATSYRLQRDRLCSGPMTRAD